MKSRGGLREISPGEWNTRVNSKQPGTRIKKSQIKKKAKNEPIFPEIDPHYLFETEQPAPLPLVESRISAQQFISKVKTLRRSPAGDFKLDKPMDGCLFFYIVLEFCLGGAVDPNVFDSTGSLNYIMDPIKEDKIVSLIVQHLISPSFQKIIECSLGKSITNMANKITLKELFAAVRVCCDPEMPVEYQKLHLGILRKKFFKGKRIVFPEVSFDVCEQIKRSKDPVVKEIGLRLVLMDLSSKVFVFWAVLRDPAGIRLYVESQIKEPQHSVKDEISDSPPLTRSEEETANGFGPEPTYSYPELLEVIDLIAEVPLLPCANEDHIFSLVYRCHPKMIPPEYSRIPPFSILFNVDLA